MGLITDGIGQFVKPTDYFAIFSGPVSMSPNKLNMHTAIYTARLQMVALFWQASLYFVPGDIVERLMSKFLLISAAAAFWPNHQPLGRFLQSRVLLMLH